ncbi:MAG: ABC transporter permease subunit [bacterium]|nr:ABC transporter permease subunit [bacterium]
MALFVTKNAFTESLLLPILDVSQSFPTFALAPLMVIILGANSLSIITTIVFATMIWPMIFSLVGAIKTEKLDLADAATIYGAKKGFKRLINYRLPSFLPAFLSGSIVAWGLGWDAIFGAEIIARVNGIGGYLGQLSYAGKAALLFLGIIIYLILIFVLNQLIWLPLLRLTTRYQND